MSKMTADEHSLISAEQAEDGTSSLESYNNNDDLSSTQGIEREGVYSATTTPNTQTAPSHKRFLLLEIPTFLSFFALFLSGTVLKNVLLYQTCTAVYEYSEDECDPLLGISTNANYTSEIESLVQPYVTKIVMVQSLIGSVVPAILSLFIGPWSDKFGRRPVLLVTFAGSAAGYIITLVFAAVSSSTLINPWVYAIGSVPSALTGGACATNTAFYCYISDMTPEEDKPKRMFLNEIAMGIGLVFGSISSGYLLAATNYVTVFAIATGVMLSALIYLYLFIKESLKGEQIGTGSKLREFFRFGLVKDLLKTCVARRQNYDRAIIWTSAIAIILNMFVLEGEGNVFYLFLRKRFEVSLKDYTFYTSIGIVAKMIGCTIALVVLKKLLNLSLIMVALIAVGGSVLESAVRASAKYWWEMYLSMALGSPSGIAGVMIQAMLSIIIPPTEMGKIFALTNAMNTLSPLAASPLYTTVYTATLNSYPGAFNIISASLYLICFTCLSTVWSLQKTFKKKPAAIDS